jgi:N-dimethylarginine dimethylaminohydrolase
MKKVLLCPPTCFDIEYEINPWMNMQNKVDQTRVQQEFQALRSVYEFLGVEMLEIPQERGLPDMVYAANFGFPIQQKFIVANFKYDERKKESHHSSEFFKRLGWDVVTLPDEIMWEGQGDLLTVGGKYYLGWGKRSDFASLEHLKKLLGDQVIDFELVNPYYYHLDTCFLPLNEETVAINPQSFTWEGLEKIYAAFPHVISVKKADNDLIACNAVVVDKEIVIAEGISQELKESFAKHGYSTHEVPMNEFRKGGGSIKCLTLEIHQ